LFILPTATGKTFDLNDKQFSPRFNSDVRQEIARKGTGKQVTNLTKSQHCLVDLAGCFFTQQSWVVALDGK